MRRFWQGKHDEACKIVFLQVFTASGRDRLLLFHLTILSKSASTGVDLGENKSHKDKQAIK